MRAYGNHFVTVVLTSPKISTSKTDLPLQFITGCKIANLLMKILLLLITLLRFSSPSVLLPVSIKLAISAPAAALLLPTFKTRCNYRERKFGFGF